MYVQQLVKRKAIPITFSRDFESLLLNYPSDHISLTHDIELATERGLQLLEELEDAHDIKHTEAIKRLIEKANRYSVVDSAHFAQWHINVSEDLLDEVDLLLLTHGEDLQALGLTTVSQGSVIVLLSVAACTHFTLQ